MHTLRTSRHVLSRIDLHFPVICDGVQRLENTNALIGNSTHVTHIVYVYCLLIIYYLVLFFLKKCVL